MTDIAAPAITRKGKHRTGAGARLNADHIVLYRTVNLGVIVTALAAVAISWQGLAAVGAWLLLPPSMTWLLPVSIDVAIIVFTIATLARRSRGESVALLLVGAYGLTAVSAAANATHVWLESPSEALPLQVYAGAFLAGLAPALILLTTEVLATLATKPPSDQSPRARQRKADAKIKQLEKDLRDARRAQKQAEARAEEAAQTPLPAPIPAPAHDAALTTPVTPVADMQAELQARHLVDTALPHPTETVWNPNVPWVGSPAQRGAN